MANNRFIRNIKIAADEQGQLPETIQLLHVGSWNTPWHGDFEITERDIREFAENYLAGVGLPEDNDGKVQINYGHFASGKAAGWLTNIRAEYIDSVLSLVGDPEWTPAGQQSLVEGEYRYISPEFNPRALPWEDPEEEWRMVANVITGAGLTNIPLFKRLKKVAASERPDSSKQSKQGEPMKFKLEEVRKLEASAITDDQRAFLETNKAELTKEEREKFGIKADAKPAEKKLKADTKEQVSISADEFAKLQADAAQGVEAAQKLAQKEASEFATDRIKAGQIKSEQKDDLVEILLASRGETRTKLESFIEGLPQDDRLQADEKGDPGKTDQQSPTEELFERAAEAVKASEGKKTLADATKELLNTDPDLLARVNSERNGSN